MNDLIDRVYHPYWEWEEIKYNMWGDVDDKKLFLEKAVIFTGDHEKYGGFMMRVIREWPISCENALTDQTLNRRAWVGHAACAMAIRCPEKITREAWGKLSDEQRVLANQKADESIREWTRVYRESRSLREDVGEPML